MSLLKQTSEYLSQAQIVSLDIDAAEGVEFVSPKTRIVLVIDISGSMGSEVISKSEDGDIESGGFNQLDLVKHASYTILENLRPTDSMAVVAFTRNARVVVPMTIMNPQNKQFVKDAIMGLHPESSTNLWDGLYKGMELLRTNPSSDGPTNDAIFLLTDGMPNNHPPRGYKATLDDYLDQYPLDMTINTFGFGYSLKVELLKEISVRGNGHYGFIPDGNFVGTIFINAMANLLTVMARNLELSLTFPEGNTPDFSDCPYPYTQTSWGYLVKLGSFRYGQARNLTFPLEKESDQDFTFQSKLTYQTFQDTQESQDNHFSVVEVETDSDAIANDFRLVFVELLGRLSENKNLEENQLGIKRLLNQITSSEYRDHPLMKGIIADLSGQVTEACSRSDWYFRWGSYYMKSLQDAHLHQHCNNFKDPGVQNYGGEDFKRFQKQLEDSFLKLPAPKPSLKKSNYAGAHFKIRGHMSNHYSSSRPCWLPDSNVQSLDGQTIKIQDLKKGDLVKTKNGQFTKVVCLIETKVNDHIEVVSLANPNDPNGICSITPWHPVWYYKTNSWMFPCDIVPVGTKFVSAVYNLVLDSHHNVVVDGWPGITLGHGASGHVLSHTYLGTSQVLDDLAQMNGWEDGHIILGNKQVQRDPKTSLIDRFVNFFDF